MKMICDDANSAVETTISHSLVCWESHNAVKVVYHKYQIVSFPGNHSQLWNSTTFFYINREIDIVLANIGANEDLDQDKSVLSALGGVKHIALMGDVVMDDAQLYTEVVHTIVRKKRAGGRTWAVSLDPSEYIPILERHLGSSSTSRYDHWEPVVLVNRSFKPRGGGSLVSGEVCMHCGISWWSTEPPRPGESSELS